MKTFKVKYGDRTFKVFADSDVEAVEKVRAVADSNKLYQLAYKLGQLANYFDRANSINSRGELSKDDKAKLQEFYSLGVQTLNQLKLEVEGMKRANVETLEYNYFGNMNSIVALLDDASNRMFWTRDPKLKVLHEKFEPLIREYENLSVLGTKKKNSRFIRRDSAVADSQYKYVNFANDSFVQMAVLEGTRQALENIKRSGKKFGMASELRSALYDAGVRKLQEVLKGVDAEFKENRQFLINYFNSQINSFVESKAGQELLDIWGKR